MIKLQIITGAMALFLFYIAIFGLKGIIPIIKEIKQKKLLNE